MKKRGFTLIELLVVISIITLLSSVVLASVNSARQKAQMSKVKSEMAEFVKALEIYRTTQGTYPTSVGCYGAGYIDTCSMGFNITDDYYDDLTSKVINELKAKKIYSGNFLNTLKSIPNTNSVNFNYTSTQAGLASYLADFGGVPSCNGKKKFDEYYMDIYVYDKSWAPVYITSSYWGKGYTDTSPNPANCSPNN